MHMRVQIIIQADDTTPPVVEEVACVERTTLAPATIGLTLAEAKDLLAHVQQSLTAHQVAAYVEQDHQCPHCQRTLVCKDHQ